MGINKKDKEDAAKEKIVKQLIADAKEVEWRLLCGTANNRK